jgi:hypothetical protein
MTPAAERGGALRFLQPATESGRSLAAARERFLRGAPDLTPGADLGRRDLSELVLAGRDLRFTRLEDAEVLTLAGADLAGADLRGLRVRTETGLRGAFYDQYTRLPFSRAEAQRQGMRYRPSAPPASQYYVDLASTRKQIARAGQAPSPQEAAQGLALDADSLLELTRRSPDHGHGVRVFKKPLHLQSMGGQFVQFELGVLEIGPDDVSRELIAEAASRGGEIRRLISIQPKNGSILRYSNAYFSVDTRSGRPYIALGPDADLAMIWHEREHFRDWCNLYDATLRQIREEAPRLGLKLPEPKLREQALEETARRFSSAQGVRETERNAVRAELRAEKLRGETDGIALAEREYRYENKEFLAKISYPELEGLRRIFGRHNLADLARDPKLEPALAEADQYARLIVRRALQLRRLWFRRQGLEAAARIDFEPFFQELIHTNRIRYAQEGSIDDIRELFRASVRSEIEKLPDDDFRRAVLAELRGVEAQRGPRPAR